MNQVYLKLDVYFLSGVLGYELHRRCPDTATFSTPVIITRPHSPSTPSRPPDLNLNPIAIFNPLHSPAYSREAVRKSVVQKTTSFSTAINRRKDVECIRTLSKSKSASIVSVVVCHVTASVSRSSSSRVNKSSSNSRPLGRCVSAFQWKCNLRQSQKQHSMPPFITALLYT